MPVPPQGVRDEAVRGLEWRREYGRGGTIVGVARARDLARGANVSAETIGRMRGYFARHEVDKQGRGWSPGEPGYPSPGRIAWALWGGDAGRRWADSEYERIAKMSEDTTARRPGRLRRLRVTRVDRVAAGANPDAHVVLYKREDLDDPTTTVADVPESPVTATSGDDRLTETETPEMTEIDRETLAPEIAEMIATLEAERDAALAKAADLEATIGDDTEPTDADETDESGDDAVLKSLDPSIRERIEKAETERTALAERIAKMEEDARVASYVAKAAEFRTVEQDSDGLGTLLADVAKNCAAESAQTLERVLKAAAARLDEAHRLITAEIGTATALDATDAGRQIETLAKARAEQTGESMPVATAAILNDNPHLYEQARAERA